MSLSSVGTFVVGLVVLVAGAEFMVRGAARLAARTGLSAVVIGLTVVAFGTSTPELAVSVQAAINDKADLTVGNVIGSNIANVLLILGLSAAVGGGLLVAQRVVRIDVPLVIGASVLTLVFALDDRIGRVEGGVMFMLLISYTVWTVRAARRESSEIAAEYEEAFEPEKLRRTPVAVDLALVVGGLVGLVAGARWLVNGASTIAADLGASDLVIGLTVVAVGTSMPELATSVVAALRGERDIAVGNVVGSNLFNLLGVLGLAAAVSPDPITIGSAAQSFDLPVMTAVAVACLPVFFNGYELRRWEGTLFVAYYVAYVTYLVLDATDHAALEPFTAAMTVFVLPLTAVTLGVVAARSWRRRPVTR